MVKAIRTPDLDGPPVQVPVDKQREALNAHFGSKRLTVESAVFSYMSRLFPAYDCGDWAYYELPNGGFYMSPAPAYDKMEIFVQSNGYRAEVSSDAAGVIVSLFAYCSVFNVCQDVNIIDQFEKLRAWAIRNHPESSEIYQAID